MALDGQLWEAAREGDAPAIERLVGEGASPDAKSKALYKAAEGGHTAAVMALLRLGADPNATDGWTALVAALLQGGAAVDAAGSMSGETALMRAAESGHCRSARLLLEAGADAALRRTAGRAKGKTALELAEEAGKSEVVALLEAHLSPAEKAAWETRKAEIEQVALDEQLWKAAEAGDAVAIERLAGEGASPGAREQDDGALLGQRPAVYMAAQGGHTAAVEALLRLGADPNTTDSDGATALEAAVARRGHAEAVRALVEGGAAVDVVTRNGATVLMVATFFGNAEYARLLLEAGADATLRPTGGEWAGKTALELAEKEGDAEVVGLLEARLSAAEKVEWGKRKAGIRLRKAAADGDTDAVAALLQGGAAVDAVGSEGGTALMFAAGKGHAGAVAALLQGGAAVDALDSEGDTALMLAAYLGRAECARLLLEAGADATLRATGGHWKGQTALELAEEEGQAEVAIVLGARLSEAEKAEWAQRKAERKAEAAKDQCIVS
eukprot:COSAG04_NODE_608_length_12095_cov_54.626709_10_plen_499_part_00